ncbi:Electron transfer flavoprotein, alpha subunit [Lunatimonas lonarensis]|uniref:Electron transfer flavoprotein, alpha subunit n=1 Tax=Lunatimonas lonarensis TaxID=1232681 RepID=R7ZXS3_9BACT|nr:electron transfer flavoprotein subunit alpha/FixB family protein [Lunatimonas lonarensis]EON78955.1 Electron transfer flavoprotein, alpha subunit [Lunatimonas lonarensis]
MAVLVYIEHEGGVVKKSSLEAVSYGKKLAESLKTDVKAVGLGSISMEEWNRVAQAGAADALHVVDERLDVGIIQAHASAVGQAFESCGAKILVLAKSSLGDAVAARLSVRLKAGMVTNVISLPSVENGFSVKRSIYTGKAFAVSEISTENKILAIRKSTVEPMMEDRQIQVEVFSAVLEDSLFQVKITGTDKAAGQISLPEADIVVSGGRGLKGPENWGIIEDLAGVLGAATGCSKPVSDMDWRPHHEHVGQTGVKVSPSLYIAVGISGAIQHLAGVNSSKNILVINKDPEAPFFKAADYGIVGDAFEVLPKLTEAIKAIK